MKTAINEAITRSESHNEIVAVDYDGTLDGLLDELSHCECEVDHETADDYVDVWGYEVDAPEGEMNWRLRVTLVDSE